jgi:hypothetical protein
VTLRLERALIGATFALGFGLAILAGPLLT